MDREQRIAFINAQVVCAQAEIEGMKAENRIRENEGKSLAYDDKAFMKIQDEYMISHNAVIQYLRD